MMLDKIGEDWRDGRRPDSFVLMLFILMGVSLANVTDDKRFYTS